VRSNFPHPSIPALGPSYTMGTGYFSGVKGQRRDVDHAPPFSAEVKKRVELYLYSPSRSSWPVLGELYLYLYLYLLAK